MHTDDTIVFHSKPGCLSSRRQQEMLRGMGFRIELKDLVSYQWSGIELESYFGSLPVPAWFNPSAPAVKSGAIDTAGIGRAEALAAMIADPLLIRRPLMEFRGRRFTGFDLDGLLGALGGALHHAGTSSGVTDVHPLERCALTPAPTDREYAS